ncbi:protein vein isoform X1 [Aphis craccivora]|uniref:Protein vein isoform X1 n=1 Tax=Aphis craccivora TaxID=307492 RepID=A0A6G0YR24_APHCR|nr:protein vein isoform X1 [Aphis craccivora]
MRFRKLSRFSVDLKIVSRASRSVSTFVQMSVEIHSKTLAATALWPLVGGPCPADLVYCLNGGTCTFYETIGELVCQCAEGFKGQRCENKDIVNKSSMYAPSLTYFCKLGLSGSYYC